VSDTVFDGTGAYVPETGQSNPGDVNLGDGAYESTLPHEPPSRRQTRALIHFPGHDSIEVAISRFPTYTIKEVENLSHEYYELVESAYAGDLDAAHSLFRNLRNCRDNSYRTESDLEAAIESLYLSHEIPSPTGEGTISISPTISSELGEATDLVWEEEWLRELYSKCEGVSEEKMAEAENWLRYSGENGSLPALRELTAMLPRSEEKFDYFQLAWNGGDIIALFNVAFLESTGWQDREPDPIQAYAGYYLFDQLLTAAIGPTSHDFSLWSSRARTYLEQSHNTLYPAELENAMDLAMEMLESNSKCCVGPAQ